jgi:hypothetical protein
MAIASKSPGFRLQIATFTCNPGWILGFRILVGVVLYRPLDWSSCHVDDTTMQNDVYYSKFTIRYSRTSRFRDPTL